MDPEKGGYDYANSMDYPGYYFDKTYCKKMWIDRDEEVTRICLYISRGLVVLGLIGNSVILLVVVQNMKRQSFYLYIILLAISDSIVLLTLFLGTYLRTLKFLHSMKMNIDLIDQNNILCKFYFYFRNLFLNYSSMLILLFSIERFTAVFKPTRVHQLCSFKRTIITCSLFFVLLAIIGSPYYFPCAGVGESHLWTSNLLSVFRLRKLDISHSSFISYYYFN